MTLEQFFDAVEALGLKWAWNKNGLLRCEKGDCPIIALARATGLDFPLINWRAGEAGGKMGLSPQDSAQIVFAADGHSFRGDNETHKLMEAKLLK